MATLEYKGHFVILNKQRGKTVYDITILNSETRKIVKTIPNVERSLRKCKVLAKDFIGF